MSYLLDTCVISEIIRRRPHAGVVKWLENCDESDLYLSVLTIGEIQKGIARLKDGDRKVSIQRWLDNELGNRFEGRILPINTSVATAWGRMQGEAELRGEPMPTVDGLLAATAMVHNLALVTRNEKDVAASGARIINPWKTGG